MSKLKQRQRWMRMTLTAISLLSPSFFSTQTESSEMVATVYVDAAHPLGTINRQVLGICLMYPPFDAADEFISATFRATSVRLWAREDAKWWDGLTAGVRSVEPCLTLAFVDKSWHPEKVSYRSATENNLFEWQRVPAVVKRVKYALDRLHALGVKQQMPLYWEVWNEPQFPINGSWEPEELARYANDCAAALHEQNPLVKVGSPLHMGDDGWNQRLCAKLDANKIDFLVTHYYNVGWHKLSRPSSEFLRRAGYGPILRRRVQRDMELIKKYGKGKWTLHCSEWNTHPPNYNPPFFTSRDMAAALYVFSAIRVYLEEGVASAQFFLLLTKGGHFGALSLDKTGSLTVRPTGAVLKLMSESLHGERLSVTVDSPTYNRDGQLSNLPTAVVPYVEALACRREDSSICVMISNKHETKPVTVRFENISLPEAATVVTVRGAGDHLDVSEVITARRTFRHNIIILPPASVSSIAWTDVR